MENKIEQYKKDYNILDYITMRGDLTFDQAPFNCVDALILSQLAYNHLEGLVSQDFGTKITLKDLLTVFENADDLDKRINMGSLINPLTPRLLLMAAASRRFASIKLSGFSEITDEDKMEQFAAVTYEISKNHYLITFRGTDDTIVGWYEDFNLGYMEEIPAQTDALLYVRRALAELKGTFSLSGHSKGGNLAVKAGMVFAKEAIKKLDSIYNFDGPGFYKEFYESPEYHKLDGKVQSFYPVFCIVGMMFEHRQPYVIVGSSNDGILQHDPFGWKLSATGFVQEKEFDEKSRFFYDTFNSWTKRLSAQEKKRFIDAFFSVLYASGVKSIYEIEQNRIVCTGKMFAKLAELKEEERKAFMNAIKVLIEVGKDKLPVINAFNIRENLTRYFGRDLLAGIK